VKGKGIASLDKLGITFAKYHHVPYIALLILIYNGSEATKPSLPLSGRHQGGGASATVSAFSQHWTSLKLLPWTRTCMLPIKKGTSQIKLRGAQCLHGQRAQLLLSGSDWSEIASR